jgi:predicted TIM-barrel fold metal-dependent hydrolase
MAPTSTGTATTYYEDYLYNSQIIAPNQVLSLVAEGVFDRHPDLRVCLAELGFAWLPSLLWRFGKDWKALENLLGLLTEDDREAVLSKNAAAFFDLQVPAVS